MYINSFNTIMKKLALFSFLFFNCSLLFAQNAAVKTRWVDGALMRSSNNVMENADSAAELSIFVTLVKAAGLADTLETTGPITVFAPTTQAFAKLPAGMLDSLQKPGNLPGLKKLVLGHIIIGNISSKDIAKQIHLNNGQAFYTTLAGTKLIATIDANRNIVLTTEGGNKSTIARFDIPQSNGILDIVTAVLAP